MHHGVKGNAGLGHPVRDADGGFALAPMSKGVRLTTGVESADRHAPPSPVQLARDEPLVDDINPPTDAHFELTPGNPPTFDLS
jgi:D-amino-acid dehydrogenase